MENREEHARQVRVIMDHCSGMEQDVLRELLNTGFDKTQTAAILGVSVNSIDKVLSRIRKKMSQS